ncbi:MAG: hypothetical protein FJX46_13525 [Alphaproteobacteria bacterium]|nr:hypothetical protein [Alphaproteobacteria bacterium]
MIVPADRRREARRPVLSGSVRIAGKSYRLVDWSFNGFKIEGDISDIEPNKDYPCDIQVDTERGSAEISGHCQLVRRDGTFSGARWAIDSIAPDSREVVKWLLAYDNELQN